MVMELQAVLLVLISSVALSSQSCGTFDCSQDYDDVCPPDEACYIYDSCMTTQSSCDEDILPTPTLTVSCYDTCIVGHPFDPSIPFQCCADLILSQNISTEVGNGYLTAKLYSPNEPGLGVYRHNTFCNYNVQCPSGLDLSYLMVRFDIEPPVAGTCLDFLRYHFTASGASVDTDACGELDDLSPQLKSGAHGSSLTMDFRSNRIHRTGDFFLAVTCTPPQPIGGARRRKRESLLTTDGASPTEQTVTSTAANYDCTPTLSFDQRVVRDYRNDSPEKYLDEVFPTTESTSKVQRITVIRAGVVIYKDNTVVVELEGKTQFVFRNIKELQVYNRIEGFLNFSGSASPQNRTFPGYGFLQVGEGIAQYLQTLVDPRSLLNDEEQVIVRDLFDELFYRGTFDAERFYFKPPRTMFTSYEKVNCSINELAELNHRSCTGVVRVAANLFLEKDILQQVCNGNSDHKQKINMQ